MKNKYLIFFILIFFSIFLSACNCNEKEVANDNKENIEVSKVEIIETSINNEETSQKELSIIENNKEINEKEIILPIVKDFKDTKDYNLIDLSKSLTFINFQNYISKDLDKNCGIYIKDNYILYNATSEGPSIEMYINEDYYAIFLYSNCILNKELKDDLIIRKNNEVLKSLLNTISPESDLLYKTIYEDYEINSTISETSYINIGSNQIKSELLQKCVIYYIKK